MRERGCRVRLWDPPVFYVETVESETLDVGKSGDDGGELGKGGETGCFYSEIGDGTEVGAERDDEPGADVAVEETEVGDVQEAHGGKAGETHEAVVEPQVLTGCCCASEEGWTLLDCEGSEIRTEGAEAGADEEEKAGDVAGVEEDVGEDVVATGGQPCTTDGAAGRERGCVGVAVVDDGVV